MAEVFNTIFELLNFGLGLPVDKTKETAIMLAANAVAFFIAFRAVGRLYDNMIIRSRKAGSALFWLFRCVVFVINWAYAYGLLLAGKLAMQHWIASLCIAAVIIVSLVTCKLIKRKKGGAANA